MAEIQPPPAGPIPVEVLEFLRAKGLEPGFSHLDVWSEEHLHAFTAAKFMREDVLAAMREAIDRAVERGQTFEMFRREAGATLDRLGFWGEQVVVDPLTGREATVQVPHRLRTIFDTNMRTARAAGQAERIQRNAETHPYLLYQVGPSERHRPEHLAWHGLMLPQDDPWWETHFPPNGWGCKCHVRAVTERQAERLERDGVLAPNPQPILDDEGNPTGHVEERRVAVRREAPIEPVVPFENRRTGRVEMVPHGIDPGFAHRPTDRVTGR